MYKFHLATLIWVTGQLEEQEQQDRALVERKHQTEREKITRTTTKNKGDNQIKRIRNFNNNIHTTIQEIGRSKERIERSIEEFEQQRNKGGEVVKNQSKISYKGAQERRNRAPSPLIFIIFLHNLNSTIAEEIR